MITKEQFLNYIKTFNKQPGEYTKEEVFEICFLHRHLIDGKNWKELINILGLENEYPDSLRRKTLNELKKKNPIVDVKDIEERFKAFSGNQIDENIEFEQLYKERVKIRDIYNSYKKDLRRDAKLEAWQEELLLAIENLNKNNPLQYHTKSIYDANFGDVKNEAVLLLSDLHIGVKCDNFYNKYNIEIAKQRVGKLVEDTIKYCRKNNVQRLNVLNLGDAIHGLIHTNARIEQEVDVAQQIIVASEIISQALFDLQTAAPEVVYRSVVDNHSRAIPAKDANLDGENFSLVIDYIIENRLTLIGSKIIFAKDNLDVGLGLFQLMNGKKFVFSHGHQEGANNCLQSAVGATRDFIDYFAMGHYHSNKLKEFQGMSVFVNGSVCGTEQYALGKRLFGDASQRLLIFENDDVLDIKINLQENR